jgi:protein SCO1/2
VKARRVYLAAAALGLSLARPALTGRAPAVGEALPYYSDATLTPSWNPAPHTVGAFALVDQTGATFTESSLTGRIHVASFLFTTCPSLCPALVTRLRKVQDAIAVPSASPQDAAAVDVLLVSYSVTPRLDTPEVLAEFGAARGIDPRRWKLLTGGEQATRQIERLMRESYFASDDRGKLLHTERVVLVDTRGRLRGVYNGTQPFDMERLIEDIAVLRSAVGTRAS